MAVDPNDIGAGLADPYVQQLADRYRQQQLMQGMARRSAAAPTTMAEALPALGTGFMDLLHGLKAGSDARTNAALAAGLSNSIGSTPIAQIPPLPSLPSGTSMPMMSTGALPSTPSIIDPQ